jgi:predicted kinase
MKKRIYIFCGMIASGKSMLAQAFSKAHTIVCFNTDRVRKELAGVSPESNCKAGLNSGIYTKEFSLQTYGVLLENAREQLKIHERPVILDGSYSTRIERERVRKLAQEINVDAVFILCRCSDQEVKRRLAIRAKDPKAVSDGNWNIYLAQKQSFEFPDELTDNELCIIDTEADITFLLKKLEDDITQKMDCL